MRHGLSVFGSSAFRSFALFAAPLAALTLSAHAHVVLDQTQAEAGTPYRAVLRVGHGCGDSAVIELIAQIPPGVRGARPMAKPGWTIEQTRDAATKAVTQIRWTGGRLDAAQFDDFVLIANLPDQPGPLTWKVTQVCESGRADWAPVLNVLPKNATPAAAASAPPAAAHQH